MMDVVQPLSPFWPLSRVRQPLKAGWTSLIILLVPFRLGLLLLYLFPDVAVHIRNGPTTRQ